MISHSYTERLIRFSCSYIKQKGSTTQILNQLNIKKGGDKVKNTYKYDTEHFSTLYLEEEWL